VIAAARAALDERENAWAAQLVNHVYLIDPQDEEAASSRPRRYASSDSCPSARSSAPST
jgi:alkyl sulfatase BDS1-like metallo-beta-lactamase superfamily hydrolase